MKIPERIDTIALGAGLLLVIIIGTAYAIGISAVASDLEQAINTDQAAAPLPVYDLDTAAKLNLKGLSTSR